MYIQFAHTLYSFSFALLLTVQTTRSRASLDSFNTTNLWAPKHGCLIDSECLCVLPRWQMNVNVHVNSDD